MREDRSVPPERDITIHLGRVKQDEVRGKDVYFKTVHDAYANSYLLSLGVAPTEASRRLVTKHAPLERCEIEASWARGSAVANELRIMQPPPGGFRAAKKEKKADAQTDGALAREIELRHGPFQYLDTRTPDVAGAPRRAGPPPRAAPGDTGDLAGDGPEAERHLVHSPTRERMLEHQAVGGLLVEELERQRRLARGEEMVADGVPSLVRWGEEGAQELAQLKRKFILPFAAQRPAREGQDEQAFVPWQTPGLTAPVEVSSPELLEDVARPLSVTLGAIAEDTLSYVTKRMPLELLTTRRDAWQFQALRERLCAPEAVQLSGLLAHIAYWAMFGHVHRPEERLPEEDRQSLILKVQELWSALVDPNRPPGQGRVARCVGGDLQPKGERPEQAALFVRPACLLAAKRGAERALQLQYPRLFSDRDHGAALSQQIWDFINALMMNIFDPECQLASFGLLNSSRSAIRLERNLSVAQMKLGLTPATRMISSCFRTTPMVTLLMNADGGGPESPKTRKLLLKSSSDAVLSAVSSHEGRRASRAGVPPMEAKRRALLYRTAVSRLQASGSEILGGGAASPSPPLRRERGPAAAVARRRSASSAGLAPA